MSSSKTGKEGENLAASFLESKGYEIIAKNYRFKRGEIDLIARSGNFLIFVEVKTRSGSGYGFPEESVGAKKAEMIITSADQYISETNWKGPIRFDIVSINIFRGGKTDIQHFEDAFY